MRCWRLVAIITNYVLGLVVALDTMVILAAIMSILLAEALGGKYMLAFALPTIQSMKPADAGKTALIVCNLKYHGGGVGQLAILGLSGRRSYRLQVGGSPIFASHSF